MRIFLNEEVKKWNQNRPQDTLKMTNTRLSKEINYNNMSDKALKEYLSHYDIGKYPCPLLVLSEIKRLLDSTYKDLLGIEKLDVSIKLSEIIDFTIDYNKRATIKDLSLVIGSIKFVRSLKKQ